MGRYQRVFEQAYLEKVSPEEKKLDSRGLDKKAEECLQSISELTDLHFNTVTPKVGAFFNKLCPQAAHEEGSEVVLGRERLGPK